MITIFCLALNVMTISGKSPVEHSFTFKLTMIVNCYSWMLFPQVPLSATRCTRLHLRCSPDLKEQPISTAHTALRTTIKSSGTNNPGMTRCCSWVTCLQIIKTQRLDWVWIWQGVQINIRPAHWQWREWPWTAVLCTSVLRGHTVEHMAAPRYKKLLITHRSSPHRTALSSSHLCSVLSKSFYRSLYWPRHRAV